MSKQRRAYNKTLSKINVVKHINDNPKGSADSLGEMYKRNIPSTEKFMGERLSSLSGKLGKRENKEDIFGQLIELANAFISSNHPTSTNDKMFSTQRLKQHSLTAASKTLNESREIVLRNISKALFAGEGLCDGNAVLPMDSVTLKPKEFDFIGTLTVDPQTPIGEIVYEPNKVSDKEKVNRNLYNTFKNNPYEFVSNNGKRLFETTWSHEEQEFTFKGLRQGGDPKISEFITDYYSSIELPEFDDIVKTAMFLTINGEGGDNTVFTDSMNKLNRLLKKLMAVCDSHNSDTQLKNQTPVDLIDDDIEEYFDFDDVDGIDIEDESRRHRKVLRFTDCNNFEVRINPHNLKDFNYLMKKYPSKAVDTALNSVAANAFAQSDGTIPLFNFNLSLLSDFILNIPKAIMTAVLSAKVFLPVVMIYKSTREFVSELDIKAVVKKFNKAVYGIINDLFWLFIRHFWALVKIDLRKFVQQLIAKIMKTKYKRYLLIVTALIALLKKALATDLDNCLALFTTILETITGALMGGRAINVPAILLLFSDSLPGYSQDRAYVNICERLEAAGISMGPVFGESNNLPLIVKSILDGHQEEVDTNSFVKIVLKGGVLPGPTGGASIIPGTISGAGKMF
jgi:hypothetical protein